MRNLQGLVSFVEAAECGSFTAAAARLEITPAAVGKNVMRLERELGVRLFHRTTRRLDLTAEGAAFLAEAGETLRRLDQAVERTAAAAGEPEGSVRISVGIAFGRRFILPLLPALTRRYPRLRLEVDLDNRLVDPAGEGFDLCIRGGLREEGGMVAMRLCDLSSVLVASPSYLAEHGVPHTPRELERHTVFGLRFASGQVAAWRFRDGLEWTPAAKVWSSDPDAFLDMAAAGQGICQAALLYAAPLLASGQLKLVLHGQYDHGSRQMMLCYPSRKLLSRRVRVVIDELAALLRSQPDLGLEVGSLPAQWQAGSGLTGPAGDGKTKRAPAPRRPR